MSDVKWIKISTGIFDDEKIKLIEAMPDSDTILVIWIKLLALAGRQNDKGEVYLTELTPYNDNMLGKIFGRKEATVKLAMRTFAEFKMIEILENQSILITNWSKHQNVEGLDKIRESGRARAERFRYKQKLLTNVEENREDKSRIEENVTSNATVTLRNVTKASPDNEQEVIEFCNSIELRKSDGTFFWNQWESNGYMNGRNKIKDWKATIRAWKAQGYCPSQKTGYNKPKL